MIEGQAGDCARVQPLAIWYEPRTHFRAADTPGSACLPVTLKACLWHDVRRFCNGTMR